VKIKKKNRRFSFDGVTQARSSLMSKIKRSGNKSTERTFRMVLVRAGISGWVLHPKNIHGKPDFFFPAIKTAVFIDGCFWHGCSICCSLPKTRRHYWNWKIRRNQNRDIEVNKELRASGIRILRVWEHSLQKKTSLKRVLQNLSTR
jgi:DNA mismatch endonuclease, patch repair protein